MDHNIVVLVLLLFNPALGLRSINLTPGWPYQSTALSGSAAQAFSNLTEIIVEARIHDFDTSQSSYKWIFNAAGLSLRTYEAGFYFYNDRDVFDGPTGQIIDVTGRTDVLVRFGRGADSVYFAELWNVDGSDYRYAGFKVKTLVPDWSSGKIELSNVPTTAKIAWMRIYSKVTTGQSFPPSPIPRDNLLANYNFEDNGNDSGPHGIDFAFDGSATFSDTPTYNPVASLLRVGSPTWTSQLSVRANVDFEIDGSFSYPLGNEEPLTYSWELRSQPGSSAIQSPNAAKISFSGTEFGSYVFKLTVTETGTGASSSAEIAIGVVPTDINGVVQHDDPLLATVFGPLILWGESPWPFLDERNYALLEYFIETLHSAPEFDSLDWSQALSGTISVTKDSTTVTGTGTDFQNDFCDGGTTGTRSLVIWYQDNNEIGRRHYDVVSCQSATQLTLYQAYSTTDSASGIQHSRLWCPACWLGGSSNINYYDNVLALYSFYYRTGLQKYLDEARRLADLWVKAPTLDEGRIWTTGLDVGPKRGPPRLQALLGVMWSAYEQKSDYLWTVVGRILTISEPQSYVGDVREDAYTLGFMSVASMLHPDASTRQQYKDSVNATLHIKWLPTRDATYKTWPVLYYGISPWNGYTGTVAVTQGSTQVIGTGTAWTADMTQNFFWVADVNGANGDSEAYLNPTFVSPTEITLPRPYEGQTATGRGWQFNNVVGRAVQPFQLGIAAQMFYYAYRATDSALASELMFNAIDFIMDYGIQESMRALYYARLSPSCEPITDNMPGCAGSPSDSLQVANARFLNGEVIAAFSRAYTVNPTQKILREGDNLVSAALGHLGGPGADDNYALELQEFIIAKSFKFKDIGFFFGVGGSATWPAARLGPSPPSSPNSPSATTTPKSVSDASGLYANVASFIMIGLLVCVM